MGLWLQDIHPSRLQQLQQFVRRLGISHYINDVVAKGDTSLPWQLYGDFSRSSFQYPLENDSIRLLRKSRQYSPKRTTYVYRLRHHPVQPVETHYAEIPNLPFVHT